MGRNAASPSTDRSVAEDPGRRGDPYQPRPQVACPQVIDDFSQPIPVLERELDAIETYLGPLIDKMLQGSE